MRKFRIVLEPSQITGQWLATIDMYGLVSQGNSPTHALHMVIEALTMILTDDASLGFDSLDRGVTDVQKED